MTLEEKRQILNDAETRVYKRIRSTPDEALDTEAFLKLLHVADHMQALLNYRLIEPDASDAMEQPPETTLTPEPEPEPEPETEPETDPETDPEAPQYKMEDVRAALSKARSKGFNITALLHEMGVKSFPELPANKYHTVMLKIQGV